MATHAIGKLKFNLSKQGLAYRWGDGEIRHLFKGSKSKNAEDETETLETGADDGYPEDFDARDGEYDADERYDDADYADGEYADDADYDDGDYDDGEYADDAEYDDRYDDDADYADDGEYDDAEYADDDRYADDDYDDDRYADDDYDDGYEDGYDDDGYEGDYDDRYSDEDADDYADDGEYEAAQSPLMRYVDENDWVTYALLFLFPPLGIYLLWRRNRFEKPIRWAITAASAIWFVVALILLLHGLFGGNGDKQTQANITIPPVAPAETIAPAATPESDDAGDEGDLGDTGDAGDLTGDGLDVEPSPTPLTGSVSGTGDAGTGNADYVYSPATGLYYHSIENCTNIEEGVSTWRVTVDIARNSRHQSPCPVCIGGGTATTYYATSGGKYYHLDSTCSKMENAKVYTREAAESEGKEPCPVCVTKTKKSLDEDENDNTVFIKSSTADKSGIQVYATKGGEHFHVKSDCSGMSGASRGSLKNALLLGKTACPVCCPTAGAKVYCTEGGKSYHIDPNCQSMKGAKQVTLGEAMVLGKTQCGVCIKNGIDDVTSSSGTLPTNSSGEVTVYATEGGKYYHVDKTCSGMKGAKEVTLKSMLLSGREACPKCAASANTQVYATPGGKYYHSYATCSDMKNAKSGTLAQAMAAGYKRCPKCWGSSKSSASSGSAQVTSSKASAARSSATASNTYVYATREGTYYHLDSSCSGMKGASRVTLKTAVNYGKKACPVCAEAATRTVYSTKNGDHYHAASTCSDSGMKNGVKRTLQEALMMNQTACQYCMFKSGSSSSASGSGSSASDDDSDEDTAAVTLKSSGIFTSGKSGIRVYATASGKYYHTDSGCGGMTNATRVTLETALNYGKRACPKCAASAERTVYATRGGKYYHYSKSDAGSGARRGTLAAALAFGFDPCPNCVQHQEDDDDDEVYSSGTSGIKVYATPSSKYYHAKANCSGLSGASRISLETALNYGKKACPVCLSVASRKVYAVRGSRYYHIYRAHAGSGAKAGTLAAALAYGLKLCPTCSAATTIGSGSPDNGGSSTAPVSKKEYSASGDSDVYIDIGSANNYYHESSRCSKAKFSGGESVTLQYARDWGYKACPYCNPPTSVSDSPEDSADA